MQKVRLNITDRNFHTLEGVRIQQGETWAGTEVQSGILKSCICVGFYCGRRCLGASSHVTDFQRDGGHHAAGAMDSMEKRLRRHGLRFSDCSCFIVGGATRARHVYDGVVAELRERGITFDELDVLGDFHRKFLFTPATGELLLLKKSTEETMTDSGSTTSADGSLECFHDPRRRVVTGATLFFRNDALAEALSGQILPDLLGRGRRLHVWCAGCSNGMEVYSAAMLILGYLDRHRLTGVDFRILGTDISPEALEMARKGEYQITDRALRSYPDLCRKYLIRPDPIRLQVGPELQRVATFIQRDIREGSRNHRFDLIICDHVMQYFPPEVQLEMLTPLVSAMVRGGYAYISSPSNVIREEVQRLDGFEVLGPCFYQRMS